MSDIFINDDFLNSVFRVAHTSIYPYERDIMEFYPSSAGANTRSGEHIGACTRANWYDKMGWPGEPTDPAGLVIMDSGTYLGKMLSDWFQKANVSVVPNAIEGELRVRICRETKKGNKYFISGRIDQIAYESNNIPIAYEFKTVWSSNKANRVIGGGRDTPAPDPKNLIQTAIYADYCRRYGILDWRLTYLYIEGKRGRSYNITVDSYKKIYVDGKEQDFTIDSIYECYDLLADSIASNTPPPQEGKAIYTVEELTEMAALGNLTKKQREAAAKDKPVLVPWSPCTYCAFIEPCWGKEIAAKIREAE